MGEFFAELWKEWPALVSGLKWTVVLTGTATATGLLGGMGLLYLLVHPSRAVRAAANAYVSFFIGTPLLALLFLAYYGLPTAGIDLSPFAASALGFGLNVSAYNARYLLGGYKAIAAKELEAAAALGFGRRRIFLHLAAPQAIRHALPGLVTQAINNLKDSSIAFLIQFDGFLGFVQNFTAQNFYFFRGYAFAAAVYLGMVALLALGARRLRRRLEIPGFS